MNRATATIAEVVEALAGDDEKVRYEAFKGFPGLSTYLASDPIRLLVILRGDKKALSAEYKIRTSLGITVDDENGAGDHEEAEEGSIASKPAGETVRTTPRPAKPRPTPTVDITQDNKASEPARTTKKSKKDQDAELERILKDLETGEPSGEEE